MKTVILAGGIGTRLAEETEIKPKPMVEIGGRPILWHIVKTCAHHGIDEFHIALGYKGNAIKRFFLEYYNLNGSMTLQLAHGHVERHGTPCEDWTIHLIDTGVATQTGGRLGAALRPGERPAGYDRVVAGAASTRNPEIFPTERRIVHAFYDPFPVCASLATA